MGTDNPTACLGEGEDNLPMTHDALASSHPLNAKVVHRVALGYASEAKKGVCVCVCKRSTGAPKDYSTKTLLLRPAYLFQNEHISNMHGLRRDHPLQRPKLQLDFH